MIKEVIFALWFFLPAGIANASPIIAAKIPYISKLNYPVDFGKNFRNKRILGDHKTWRGIIVGVICATVILWLQQILVRDFEWARQITSQVNYSKLPTLVMGPLFGLGALGGDAVESFFKRQVGIPPGQGWFPFDQTDYIIGGALATAPFVSLDFIQYIVLLLLWLLMHIVASYIGFLLKLKERPI